MISEFTCMSYYKKRNSMKVREEIRITYNLVLHVTIKNLAICANLQIYFSRLCATSKLFLKFIFTIFA